MNTPETIYHQLLDSFTSSHVCFALYRLPWTDEPILIMQEEGEPEYIHSLNELNQKKGFLLSPFQFTPAHPAVLIRPDIQAHDWEEIKSALQGWMTRHPQQAAPSHSIDASTDSHITSEKEEKTCTLKHSAASSCHSRKSSSVNLYCPAVQLTR